MSSKRWRLRLTWLQVQTCLFFCSFMAIGEIRGLASSRASLVWQTEYWPTNHLPEASVFDPVLALDDKGNLMVGAVLATNTHQHARSILCKYENTSGRQVWEALHGPYVGGPDSLRSFAQVVTHDGDVVVTGPQLHVGPEGQTQSVFLTTRFSGTNGEVIWQRTQVADQGLDAIPLALTLDRNGDVIVTGAAGRQVYAAKYAGKDGNLRWETVRNTPDTMSNVALSLSADKDANVIIAGRHGGFNDGPARAYVAKLRGSDGNLLWEQQYRGLSDYHTGLFALRVFADDENNVIIVGNAETDWLADEDFFVAKLRASDGGILWERFDSPIPFGGRSESVLWAGMDPYGDLIVAELKSYPRELYKFAGQDGTLLWRITNSIPNARIDVYPEAFTFDSAANLVVAGTSSASISKRDFYAAKFARGNGSLLWEALHSSPMGQFSFPASVAVDPLGDVTVVGMVSRGQSSDHALHVAKLADNCIPVAMSGGFATVINVERRFMLIASDEDGDRLSYRVSRPPAHGDLSGEPPEIIYTPRPNFQGKDSFTFVASDGASESLPATVAIYVANAGLADITTARVNGDDFVIVSWPAECTSCVLEQTASIAPGEVWTPSSELPLVREGRRFVEIRLSHGVASFYRVTIR